jgi:hypothetical protein
MELLLPDRRQSKAMEFAIARQALLATAQYTHSILLGITKNKDQHLLVFFLCLSPG